MNPGSPGRSPTARPEAPRTLDGQARQQLGEDRGMGEGDRVSGIAPADSPAIANDQHDGPLHARPFNLMPRGLSNSRDFRTALVLSERHVDEAGGRGGAAESASDAAEYAADATGVHTHPPPGTHHDCGADRARLVGRVGSCSRTFGRGLAGGDDAGRAVGWRLRRKLPDSRAAAALPDHEAPTLGFVRRTRARGTGSAYARAAPPRQSAARLISAARRETRRCARRSPRPCPPAGSVRRPR